MFAIPSSEFAAWLDSACGWFVSQAATESETAGLCSQLVGSVWQAPSTTTLSSAATAAFVLLPLATSLGALVLHLVEASTMSRERKLREIYGTWWPAVLWHLVALAQRTRLHHFCPVALSASCCTPVVVGFSFMFRTLARH